MALDGIDASNTSTFGPRSGCAPACSAVAFGNPLSAPKSTTHTEILAILIRVTPPSEFMRTLHLRVTQTNPRQPRMLPVQRAFGNVHSWTHWRAQSENGGARGDLFPMISKTMTRRSFVRLS